MTRKELIHILQSGDENERVMIDGQAISNIDNVPAEGGEIGYIDLTGM